MIIRRAQTTDLKAIAGIQSQSWRDTYTSILPKEYLCNQVVSDTQRHWRELKILDDDIVLVAEENKLIGFIAVWCRPDPFIDNLHVIPTHRRQKVGTVLMASMAQRLLALGKKTAYLWVFSSNSHAIRFYERLGGIRGEEANKIVFGHEVPSVKMEWEDLSAICGS